MGGAGGAAAAVGLAAVLAVELVLMQRLNRRDAVPLATAAQRCFGRSGMRWVRPC